MDAITEYFRLAPDLEAAREAADQLFALTASRLRTLLPPSADIRHIGATAIPGCLTKGDLDIVVRIEPAEFAAADEALASRYARNTGSVRTDQFSAFLDDSTTPQLGIQLTAVGGPHDVFHNFLDALRDDPVLVERYNALKRTFDGMPMDAYRSAKDEFVTAVLAARSDRIC